MTTSISKRVAVAGVPGRMGREIAQALIEQPHGLCLSAGTARSDSPFIGRSIGDLTGSGVADVKIDSVLAADEFDVLIDFTNPELSITHCEFCQDNDKAIVIGTTGFDSGQLEIMKEMAKEIPMVLAPNMSVGVNLLFHVLAEVAATFGQEADIEITETHHKHKLDAPSGTALRMGEVIAKSIGVDLEDAAIYDRHGIGEPRKPGTIGFTSLRAGSVIGDHTALFATEGERLEISHKASSREIYAQGALRAAAWLLHQSPGLYGMQDVLGLVSES